MKMLKLILSLCLCSSLFAANRDDGMDVIRKIECDALKCQPCQQDPCNPCCRLIPAYNAPSRPEEICSWDLYVTGSFIYWQAIQENMAVAELFNLGTNIASAALASQLTTVQQLNFKNKYKPGFKVDLGFKFNYDNWDLYAEYTWYHTNHITTQYTAPGLAIDSSGFTGPVLASRAIPISVFPTSYRVFNEITKTWKLKLDFIDLMLARSYYVGKKLTFRPAFGARAAYIRQKITLNETSNDIVATVGTIFTTGVNRFFSDSILSWGYGLRGLLDVQYLFGAGFRMLGNGAFDLLYTRYNLKQNFNTLNQPSSNLAVGVINKITDRHDDFLRPHAELEFGFGWGNCFGNGRWYVDFEAAYGFQVFWDQNMSLLGTATTMTQYPSANLFLHGARFTARVDF